MKNIFYTLMAATFVFLPFVASDCFADDRKTFRNNTGHVVYGIIRTMPSDMRKNFRDTLQERYHGEWHKDMKKSHIEMKSMVEAVRDELKKPKPNQKKIADALKRVEDKVMANGRAAAARTRAILAEVIAKGSAEERAEMAEDLGEVLEDWENYRVAKPRWWQFWR